MAPSQFHLPDVGEGLTEAEIVTWHVAPGDTVSVNQVLVEIETAKSLVELPSPYAGVVQALEAEAGETVAVGSPIISILEEGSARPSDEPAPRPEVAAATEDEEPALLVGYGAKETTRRRRRPAAHVSETTVPPTTTARARAKPPVRRLAKTLGVDLLSLTPSGPGGIVTRADVLGAAPSDDLAAPEAHHADEVRIPIKGVRKHTAAAMVRSAFTAPHVTEFVTVDVTPMMDLKDRVSRRRDFVGVKLSPLTFVAAAYLKALSLTPEANSRWDEDAQEIVQMRRVNLGIAAATPRGLIVPNIKDAQDLSVRQLALAIADLASTAREGRTTPAAQAGGTTTVTNVGVFGVDTGTPILNPGESAILAVGAIRRMPWVVGSGADERIEPRWVTQLALSFDHRVVDGQQGSTVLANTAAMLNDPALVAVL